tara:strand:- start:803 stop:1255 length:453 start_codon:yes stop_codon:yes gene_type:complete
MGENIMGQITAKYDPKKPGDNYTVYIQGSEGTDYRVYLPKCDYGKDDVVEIKSATQKTSGKGSVYYQANNIALLGDEPKTNGHTEPTRQPITNSTSSTLSKGEEMLVTGIWTRSVTSNKTPEQVAAHADAALAYIKRLIGGNDEPFNDQF